MTCNGTSRPNPAASGNGAIASQFHIVRRARAVPEPQRSPAIRVRRGKMKSRRDDLIVAQGERGTSAALGYGRKMIFSLFSFSGLARLKRAKPEKEKGESLIVGVIYPGRRPRRPCPGLLSGRPSGAPERRTRTLQRTRGVAFCLSCWPCGPSRLSFFVLPHKIYERTGFECFLPGGKAWSVPNVLRDCGRYECDGCY